MALYLERLSDDHFREVSDFDCGIEYQPISDFLKSEAFQYNITGEGNTYIIKSNVKNQIIAYYTLRCNSIQMENPDFSDLPDSDKRKYIVVPTVELSRFGVHMDYQNKRIGQLVLLNYILPHIFYIKKLVGVEAILVLSLKDERTEHVYKKIGFNEMDNKLQTLIEYDNDECVSMIIKLDKSDKNIFKKLNNEINDMKDIVHSICCVN